MSPDILTLSSSMVGFVVPWIVSLIRLHLLPWSDKSAIWIALVVSMCTVSVAYFTTVHPPTLLGFFSNIGISFSISQMVYQHIKEGLDDKDV